MRWSCCARGTSEDETAHESEGEALDDEQSHDPDGGPRGEGPLPREGERASLSDGCAQKGRRQQQGQEWRTAKASVQESDMGCALARKMTTRREAACPATASRAAQHAQAWGSSRFAIEQPRAQPQSVERERAHQPAPGQLWRRLGRPGPLTAPPARRGRGPARCWRRRASRRPSAARRRERQRVQALSRSTRVLARRGNSMKDGGSGTAVTLRGGGSEPRGL